MAVAADIERATDSTTDWVAEHVQQYVASGGTEGHDWRGRADAGARHHRRPHRRAAAHRAHLRHERRRPRRRRLGGRRPGGPAVVPEPARRAAGRRPRRHPEADRPRPHRRARRSGVRSGSRWRASSRSTRTTRARPTARSPSSCSRRRPEHAAMRLATFNLLHGRSPHDGVVCAGPPAGRGDRGWTPTCSRSRRSTTTQPRSALVDQTALVARAVGAARRRFLPALVGTPGGSWREAGPDEVPGAEPTYGIGLVSRRPVAAWQRIPLGTSRLTLPLLVDARRPALVRDEPRLGLAAVLAPPAPVGTVVATHLAFAPGSTSCSCGGWRGRCGTCPARSCCSGTSTCRGRCPARCCAVALAGPRAHVPRRGARASSSTTSLARPPGRPLPADARDRATPVSDHRALVVDLARTELGRGPATAPITMTAGGRRPASAMAPGSFASVARVVTSPGSPPSWTASAGVSGSRPAATSASVIAPMFSTAMSSTIVPRSAPERRPSRPATARARAAGGPRRP